MNINRMNNSLAGKSLAADDQFVQAEPEQVSDLELISVTGGVVTCSYTCGCPDTHE